jgi:ABC-type sulfate/molybdate transport systems ATPase subunit
MIREFNNKEQSDLMKLIQDLRDSGVSKHINLPQLVVVGDQSSGKSSVLQAIAGIPFPQNSG